MPDSARIVLLRSRRVKRIWPDGKFEVNLAMLNPKLQTTNFRKVFWSLKFEILPRSRDVSQNFAGL